MDRILLGEKREDNMNKSVEKEKANREKYIKRHRMEEINVWR